MRCWLRIHLSVLAIALSAALGLAWSLTDGALQSAQAQDSSLEFRDALSAYGRWSEHPRWGAVWIPADVGMVLGVGRGVGMDDLSLRPLVVGRRLWLVLDSRRRLGARMGELAAR